MIEHGDGFVNFEDGPAPARSAYLPVGTINHYEELLYHYTNLSAFQSIIKNQCIWLSQHSSMNDPQEILYAWNLLKIRVSWMMEEDKKIALEELVEPYYKFFVSSDFFFASFSTFGDSLSQWREYGGRDGLSIGLAKDLFLTPLAQQQYGLRVSDVVYNRDNQKVMLDPIAEWMIAQGGKHGNEIKMMDESHDIATQFQELAITFKQPGYHYERETRVITTPSKHVVRTRQGADGATIKYISLDLISLFAACNACDILFDTVGVAPSDDPTRKIGEARDVFTKDRIKFREIVASSHKFRW